MRGFVCALALLAIGASALESSNNWKQSHFLAPEQSVRVHLAIRHEEAQMDTFRTFLGEVSDPSHANYGAYATTDGLKDMLAPPPSRVDAVMAWVKTHVAEDAQMKFNKYQDYLTVVMPAAKANALFDAKMAYWKATSGPAHHHVRSVGSHRIPVELAAHVEYVAGLSEPFPTLQNKPDVSRGDERVGKAAGAPSQPCLYEPGPTPDCLFDAYGIDATASSGTKATMAVVEFAGSYYLESDLAEFQTRYGVEKDSVSDVQGIIPSSADAGTEASLDIQYIMGIAQGVPATYIQIPSTTATPFLDWAMAQLELDANDIAQVQSVSWGTAEYEYEDEVGVDRLNVELMKLGALGVSIVVATGDDGAGCHASSYMPNFPATSPYVTAVGGVWIPPITSTYKIEGDSISGGGFATSKGNNRTQASWQEDQVSSYQAACGVKDSKYVAEGRGIPDVAAFSAYYNYYRNGGASQVDGTSAAAPVWAGIIALINDQRLEAGKSTMGFLNPWLYSLDGTDAFTDITSGTNNDGGCLHTGYPAMEGWDAVTGLGTPMFPELLAAAMDP
mmetsp:Transcript_89408/g.255308  ORF Transcript_89408/g.255308 Transcript_89408/m.255308 type:complete len:559 (-) Transcript_89408:594-2270(-)|eukprot:CAMPEP_0119481790 /NCGR_PEP_ID=MMETSP1344-20130328/9957_1 /TAXON_ID=236787 /ORGANISM="Florenciella parvula, Strain CCMP2471" /LENGTH=558 /DNA_ID=CAMNT_0007516169 /DNA_START=90 /DNA_END=1766 /DNA_ORIENTATION=+